MEEKMKDKFYISTAIAYTSSKPHLGNTYDVVLADVIARYKRLRGYDVYFQTGTDEHGEKIELKARENNISPQEYVDNIASCVKDVWDSLNTSYDKFVRTTNSKHKELASKIFDKLYEKGDIYKGNYKGLYCVPCESFWTESQLVSGNCPDCGRPVKEASEECYFFKTSNYSRWLYDYIESHPGFIEPESRKNEIINNFIKPGLQDLCVSRTTFKWGIPVSFDSNHVIYVWIDALSNYITAIGYDTENPSEQFKQLWPVDVHVIGKDILKFHSIYWIGILMALDLPLPKHIYAHGWITIDETKMSKSLGNVVSPTSVLEHYNLEHPDAFRYYMATSAPCGRDGNYSDQDFKEKVNAHLANSMGNLLNRSLSMLVKYFDSEIKEEFLTNRSKEAESLIKTALGTIKIVENHFNHFEIQEAAQAIISLVDATNKFVTDNAPWTLAKEEKMTECGQVLATVLEIMCIISSLIYPYCPNIAADMAQQLSYDLTQKLDDIKSDNIKTGKLISKEEIHPVFLRVDSELADKSKK